MGQEEIFRKELAELLRLGKKQGNQLSKEQVSEGFPDSGIDKSKLSFIYDYLAQNKITVGEISEREEVLEAEEALSSEDRDFLKISSCPIPSPVLIHLYGKFLQLVYIILHYVYLSI